MKRTLLGLATIAMAGCAAIRAYEEADRAAAMPTTPESMMAARPAATKSAAAPAATKAGAPAAAKAASPGATRAAEAPAATKAAPPAVAAKSAGGAPAKMAPVPRREAILRLHGSNTIGSELAPRLADAFLRTLGAANVRVDDSDRANHHTWVLGEMGPRRVAIEVWAPGSKVAFQSLAAHRCDIGMASRAAETREATGAERVVGLDGVAVIVNKSNPVTRLTVQQVADIFGGVISDWAQLGAPAGHIQVYARDEKSGTYETFKQLVMRGRSIQWTGAGAYEGSAALADAVAGDAHGIGFVGLPYVRETRALALQDGAATPLYPTVFTVSTEDYLLSRRLRFYTAAQPGNPLVQRFLDFALSEAGQRIVADSGFIPLTVHAQAVSPPKDAPDHYLKATRGGQRLSVNFRFKKGSAELDGKALQDVDSVVRFLSASDSYRARRMMLFGFADRSGKEAVNRALSKQRADAVATELKERGVALDKVEGFGSALPLATGTSDEARERNRRVEVWVH